MRDVKLWFAYNENKEVIKINDADINKIYKCPCCGADVFSRATKSKKVTMHFCHVSGESCSTNGGESYIHKWIKTVLFTPNQVIKVNTKDGIKEYAVKEVEIEKRYETSQGDYIPDISILTYEGEKIFVEIYNTNKKSIKKYWLKWFELGNTVIEIAVDDIINKDLDSMVLEPIYENSDRFKNFEESDYNKMMGKNVGRGELERLKKLYDDVYDYINGKGDIKKMVEHEKGYMFNKKYICSTIIDELIKDVKCYRRLTYDMVEKGLGVDFPDSYYNTTWGILEKAKRDRLRNKLKELSILNTDDKEINEILDICKKIYGEDTTVDFKRRFIRNFYNQIYPHYSWDVSKKDWDYSDKELNFINKNEGEFYNKYIEMLSEGVEDYVYKLENFTYKSNRD